MQCMYVETTLFRIGLFVSGGLYMIGSFLWWQLSGCQREHELLRADGSVGVSWYLISFGGVFNMIGSMLSFKNPDERIKYTKKRNKQRHSSKMAIVHAATTSMMSPDTQY